jgi:CBS domain-containing protein
MKLRNLIRNHALITITADDSIDLALQVMLWGSVRHLPVLDREHLVGILSQRDIVIHQSNVGVRIAERSLVREIMSVPPITATPEQPLEDAMTIMVRNKIGCVPIVEGHKLIGIVTRSDFLAQQIRQKPATTKGEENVTSIMRTDLLTAHSDDYLMDAVGRMETRGVRHLPVVDGDGRLVGMLSDSDVRTAYGNSLRPLGPGDARVRLQSTRVGDAMSRKPFRVDRSATIEEISHRFVDHRIGAIAVVDPDEKLLGMVSYVDVLAAVVPARPSTPETGGHESAAPPLAPNVEVVTR